MIAIGDPADPAVALGPLIRQQQRERVEGYVASGVEQGAQLVVGGKRPEGLDKGFFYEPTIFTGVSNNMKIAQEEIFGPVLSVITYETEDEAIRIANDSIYGLAGYVLGQTAARAFNVARQIRTGNLQAIGMGGMLTAPAEGATNPGEAVDPAGAEPVPSEWAVASGVASNRVASVVSGAGMGSRNSTELKSITWT